MPGAREAELWPAEVLKDVVSRCLEDVRQVAWNCWPVAVWHTSLMNHPSVVVIPEEGILGNTISESVDSGARLPPYNLRLIG